MQRDKAACPRSYSWSEVEAGPGALINLQSNSWGKPGTKQAPAASLLGPDGGWQDTLLSKKHSVTLDKSLPLAGPQFPCYERVQAR